MSMRLAGLMLITVLTLLIAWLFYTGYFDQWFAIKPQQQPPVSAVAPLNNDLSDIKPSAAAEPTDQEEMLAGVPLSKAHGQFAAERPADLDPYRRWAPPVVRAQWLAKSETLMLQKHTYAANAEYRGVYFHLGFKDKPATCGEVRLIDHDGGPIGNFERFIYPGRGAIYLASELPGSFNSIWSKLCVATLGSAIEE